MLGIVFAPLIVDLYTSGVPAEDQASRPRVATFFLRWFMPQIVFYGVGAVAIGLLQAHRRFAAPMFAPILNNVIVIATFLIFAAHAGAAARFRRARDDGPAATCSRSGRRPASRQ